MRENFFTNTCKKVIAQPISSLKAFTTYG